MDEGEHPKIYGGYTDGMGMKIYLHGPIDYAINMKLRFWIGVLERGIPVSE